MWIEKTKTGKYKFCERYFDDLTQKKKKISVTYDKNNAMTRKAAMKELAEKIENKKIIAGTAEITLSYAAKTYLEHKKTTLKESSYLGIQWTIKKAVDLVGPDLILNMQATNYINKVLENETASLKKRFRAMLRFCFYTVPLLDADISVRISTKSLNSDFKKDSSKKYFEKEEIQEILATLDNSTENSYSVKMLRLLIEFLTLTGLRIGECSALTKADYNKEDSTIDINKTYVPDLQKTQTPKTRSSCRTIALNSRAKTIIAEMEFLKRVYCINSDLLFPTSLGHHFTTGGILPILKRHNLDTRMHIYRHTHASLLAEQGVNLEAIQRRLGHENSKITKEIYIHVTNKIKEEERNLFKNLSIL